jgi:hypothetical protein
MKCGITKNDESCLQVLMHRRNYTYESASVNLPAEKRLYSEAKRRDMDRITAQHAPRRLTHYGVE